MYDKLEQLEFKQEKFFGIQKHAGKVRNEDFDQIYLNTGSKTQNVEKLSLGLIFYNNFW